MSRLRPTRIEYVVDGARLRAQLTAAALDALGDEAEQRRRALEVLRAALFRGRMIAKERLENGAGGIETARLNSRVADEVITALYDFTTVHVFRARNPTEGERLALMAMGGYGRGALAPFSDVDLLFLRPYKQTPHVESVIEYMLYALWDLGFKVGHASRTIDDCVKLSRTDFTIRTALLETRLLAGDAELARDFKQRFRKEVMEGTGPEFVAAKLKERDDRHTRAGASRYLVEPNVKEGKGGLRDLNTLFWIAQYLHPSDTPSELVRLEAFTGRELKAFIRAFDFLWAVRAHLHYATGRPEERLTFDLQPEIARRMGYVDKTAQGSEAAIEPAVERFMRRYFLIAREVGVLTRVFCAQLEDQQAKKRPAGLSRFLPGLLRGSRRPLEAGFHIEGGRLTVDGAGEFERDPVQLLRLFKLADQRNLDLHPDAYACVNRSLNLITPKLRRDPQAAAVFLDILTRGRDTYRALTLMNESGVLGRYLPEFGHIVAQMQFNMYHSYTVDEHTLRAVAAVAAMRAGSLSDELGGDLARQVAPLIEDWESVFLAMLLHDTGKGGQGGQSLAGARAARSACERLHLPSEQINLVVWLVEHHLVMSDYAQKRDVADPRTVSDFVEIMERPERMRQLLVLTIADIQAVGPGVWNGWKGQLLRELYLAAEAVFRGGRGPDLANLFRLRQVELAMQSRRQFISAASEGTIPSREQWASEMEDAYFNAFGDEDHQDHYMLSQRAGEQGGAAARERLAPGGLVTEVAVAARDRRGLFADLAGVLAAYGANVVGARIYTSSAGKVLDVFLVQDALGSAYGYENPEARARLVKALEAAALGEWTRGDSTKPVDLGRAAAFAVAPSVTVDNEASETCTVVEVSGRDRPGLLESLARALTEAGLSLQSAHVDCYGERAVDAFYVSDANGGKLVEAPRISALRDVLASILEDAEPEPVRARPRRMRARASRAR
ncbi:MAG: [protein-PII] uridylyltransferase [Pseudomonadota bacterium]|jgi:[protein-PII] uridylyltransferase